MAVVNSRKPTAKKRVIVVANATLSQDFVIFMQTYSNGVSFRQGMRILSDFHKDVQTLKESPGSYEWWYFDAISENDYSVVIIFYDGNPFSRRYIERLEEDPNVNASEFPAISISVYHKNKPLFYAFEEVLREESEFSRQTPSVSIGNCHLKGVDTGSEMVYTLSLDHTLVNGDRLKGELVFESAATHSSGITTNTDAEDIKHTWNLVMPKGRVTGDLELTGYHEQSIPFSGMGYHDHNCGSEPMKESFREWYWGRYHLSNSTLIYYLMLENSEWEMKAWLLGDKGDLLPFDGKIRMDDKQLSLFGLKSARKITFKTNGVEGLLQLSRLIDDGPFYQRYQGDLILHSGNGVEKASGISEYIYPSRIYSRLFWPLVNMRIRYPGKPHWVQQSPRLYRWTW